MVSTNNVKQISGNDTFFFKNVFKYVLLLIISTFLVVSITNQNFPAIVISGAMFVAYFIAFILSFWVRTADVVILDYGKQIIIFIYRNKNARIEKKFEDFLKIKRKGRSLIKIIFKDQEKHSFRLQQFDFFAPGKQDSIYKELKDILEHKVDTD